MFNDSDCNFQKCLKEKIANSEMRNKRKRRLHRTVRSVDTDIFYVLFLMVRCLVFMMILDYYQIEIFGASQMVLNRMCSVVLACSFDLIYKRCYRICASSKSDHMKKKTNA